MPCVVVKYLLGSISNCKQLEKRLFSLACQLLVDFLNHLGKLRFFSSSIPRKLPTQADPRWLATIGRQHILSRTFLLSYRIDSLECQARYPKFSADIIRRTPLMSFISHIENNGATVNALQPAHSARPILVTFFEAKGKNNIVLCLFSLSLSQAGVGLLLSYFTLTDHRNNTTLSFNRWNNYSLLYLTFCCRQIGFYARLLNSSQALWSYVCLLPTFSYFFGKPTNIQSRDRNWKYHWTRFMT